MPWVVVSVTNLTQSNHCLHVSQDGLPVNVLAVFDGAEEDDTGDSVAQQQQEHAHDNKETLVHADDHS